MKRKYFHSVFQYTLCGFLGYTILFSSRRFSTGPFILDTDNDLGRIGCGLFRRTTAANTDGRFSGCTLGGFFSRTVRVKYSAGRSAIYEDEHHAEWQNQ